MEFHDTIYYRPHPDLAPEEVKVIAIETRTLKAWYPSQGDDTPNSPSEVIEMWAVTAEGHVYRKRNAHLYGVAYLPKIPFWREMIGWEEVYGEELRFLPESLVGALRLHNVTPKRRGD